MRYLVVLLFLLIGCEAKNEDATQSFKLPEELKITKLFGFLLVVVQFFMFWLKKMTKFVKSLGQHKRAKILIIRLL